MQHEQSPHELILASAGAGKTFALSNRYLSLLAAGARPGGILATTFTRKAAGEILGRVLQRLAEAAAGEAAAAALGQHIGRPGMGSREASQLLQALGHALASVNICTIDSFFNRMAISFRYELGLPAAPRLVDEASPAVRQLRRRAIDAMLADDDHQLLANLLRRLHHDQAKRGISQSLNGIFSTLYGLHRQTVRAAWHALQPPATLSPPELAEAMDRLRFAEALLPASKPWMTAWRNGLDAAERNDWPAFLEKGIAAACSKTPPKFSSRDISADILAIYQPLCDHARAAIIRQHAEQAAAMRDLLERFDTHFSRLKQEQGIILFSDLPHLLAEAMDDADVVMDELYFRLDGRVQHLLLDEFQDTSPMQWSILRPFAQEICSGEGVDEQPSRSLFCVGDVKQSIYGWRGGCPEVFDAVRHDLSLPDTAVKSLSQSYRSSQVVLDVVNRVFSDLSSCAALADRQRAASRWEAGYREHRAARQLPGYVAMLTSPPPTDSPPAGAELAAGDEAGEPPEPADHLSFVAQYVRALHNEHPVRSIGVLTRGNATAAELVRLLGEAGVPVSGEGASSLQSEAAVELVLSALTLTDHPGHTASAFHVLHSPLAAPLGLTDLDERHLDAVAKRIRRQLMDQGYAAVIARWVAHLQPLCNARSMSRLTQLIELADAYDPAVTLRVRDFVEHVRETRVEEPSSAPVRVMTTHRAKGLEFDLVVLCELNPRVGDVRELVWARRPRPAAPPDAVYAAVRKELRQCIAEHDPQVQVAYEQEVDRRCGDDLSAMYVAMTRARHALHMILQPLKRTKNGWSSVGLSNCSPAAILRQQLMVDPAEPPEGLLFRAGDPDWDRHVPWTADATEATTPAAMPSLHWIPGGAPRRSWSVVTPSSLEDGGAVAVDQLLTLASRRAMDYGTRVHDQLAAIRWVHELDPAAASPELQVILARPAVRDALSCPGEGAEVWREQPFAVRVNGQLLRGTFDRVVRTPDHAWLIDFKTDSYSDEAVRRYRPQMNAYRTALQQMLQLPAEAVRATLLFVSTGVAIDLAGS